MSSTNEPPLVDVKVTNPVTYLRRFWEKVIGNEGMELKVTIKPLTTIAGIVLLGSIALGLGRFVFPDDFSIPFFAYNGEVSSKPTPTDDANDDWKETAYTGKLQYSISNQKYFLLTTSSEAITLEAPENLDLLKLVGKRIFAVGNYSKKQRILKVSDVKDLEVLPTTPVPLPTLEASPTPVVTSTPSASPQEMMYEN